MLLSIFVFVFALTMADNDTTRVEKGQEDGDRQGGSRHVPHRSGNALQGIIYSVTLSFCRGLNKIRHKSASATI
jgi:hypothetical protein